MISENDFYLVFSKYFENKKRALKRYDSDDFSFIKFRNQLKDINKRVGYLAELKPIFEEPVKYTKYLLQITFAISNEFVISSNFLLDLQNILIDKTSELESIRINYFTPLSEELINLALKANWSLTKLITSLSPNDFKTYYNKKIKLTFDDTFEKLNSIDNSFFDAQRCLNVKEIHDKELGDARDHLTHIPYYYRQITSQLDLILGNIDLMPNNEEVINLLKKGNFNSALNILNKTHELLKDELWPEAIGNCRIVLELIVTKIVQIILNKSNWNQPYKDAIEILHQNSIVPDKETHIHVTARDVGVYGYLSVKGVHSDGGSSDNLAKTNFEAEYAVGLATNLIKHLLNSFYNSEYYINE